MKMLSFFLIFISVFSCANTQVEKLVNEGGYSNDFKVNFKAAKRDGSNFNHDDYIFSYPCGGGAVCLTIYSSNYDVFIDFPDNYIGASNEVPLNVKFDLNSNKFCVWGESAYDKKVYRNSCYRLEGRAVINAD